MIRALPAGTLPLIYEKLGSLWPCVITHLAADGAMLWVIAAIRSSPA